MQEWLLTSLTEYEEAAFSAERLRSKSSKPMWSPFYSIGCETKENKLNVFQHTCLRKILKVYWPMRVSNEEIIKKKVSHTRTHDEQVRFR